MQITTFAWPPEVRWPPPANILANYDVVPPGVAVLMEEEQRLRREHMPLAYIQFLDPQGRPVDPGYGVGEGHPDQGLPGGGGGGRPGHLPAWGGGRPVDPGFGNPGWGGPRPGQGLPHPGRPVDPDWGWGGGGGGGGERPDQGLPGGGGQGGSAGQLPVWPLGPEHGLPPIPGQPLPPIDPPPGTIWPPLPPGTVPPGKTLVLVYISGVGSRYAVITVSPPKPDQGLPGGGEDGGEGEGGEHPDQGLPGQPPRPGHPIAPGGGRPVDPGFGNPGRPGRPPTPGQPLPPDPAHPDQGGPAPTPSPKQRY